MKKIISILGSTGSIGLSTLSIVDKKKKILRVNFLSANKNYRIICKQIIKYKPKYFIIKNKLIFNKIKAKFKNNKTIILNDYKFKKFQRSDVIVSAIPGIGGLDPTLNLIKFTKKYSLLIKSQSFVDGTY